MGDQNRKSSGGTKAAPALLNESGVVPKLWEDEIEATRTTPTWMGVALSARPAKRPALVVMTGSAAGRVLPIQATKLTIGRSKQADFTLGDEGVSRMHCGIAREGRVHHLSDLGSTHGTRVNGRPAERVELKAGDLIQVGPNVVVQFDYYDEAADGLATKLYEGATRDLLTHALNQRAFDERLTAEVAYAVRHSAKLAAIAVEVEGLEEVSEAHGHAARDAVLREVAATISSTLRGEDVFARTGDVSFIVLARGLSRADAVTLGDRVRVRVAKLVVTFETLRLKATFHAGVAELAETDAAETLLQLARERCERRPP